MRSRSASWAEILEELGAKLPPRFIWVTDIKALSDGKPYVQSAGPPPLTPTQKSDTPKQAGTAQKRGPQSTEGPSKIDGLEVSGLYLANPPNEKEARIIDEFVDQLQKSEVFKIEEKDKPRWSFSAQRPTDKAGHIATRSSCPCGIHFLP
jgi:hypothetical protein